MTFGGSKKLVVLFACLMQSPSALLAESPGGSNYGWFAVEKCARDSFAVIPNIDTHYDAIKNQLSVMYERGQRRLRIPIFFSESSLDGYLHISDGGISEADQAKIERLFFTIRTLGFDGIIISFFPQGANLASSGTFAPASAETNFQVISQVRNIARQTRISYIIDLQNEGIAASNQQEMLDYSSKLWLRYNKEFGHDDTLGFSLIPDVGRITNLEKVYGANPPEVMDLHVYGNPYETLVSALSAIKRMGFASFSLIVGETYYDNAAEIAKIRAAANVSGVRILFITQWPQPEGGACDNVSVIPLEIPANLVHPPLQ